MTWNDGLSADQEDAAGHSGTHARLLAGPGTGKTRVLTRRVVYLLTEEHIDPDEIVALTFTRAAASELRARAKRRLEETWDREIEDDELPRISTLHSFALRQLLRNSDKLERLPQPLRIADDWEERHIVLEDLKAELELDAISDARELKKQLAADWQTLAAEEEDYTPDPAFIGAWQEHRDVYGYTLRDELLYQLKRALQQVGDFDLETPIRHLLVDEYQDLNQCDLAVVRELAANEAELFVAGDDDQSIYGFRKAHPEGIRRFRDEYDEARDLPLERCYRCDPEILDLSRFIAELDHRREPKELRARPDRDGGEVALLRFDNQWAEASAIAEMCRRIFDAQQVEDEEAEADHGLLLLLRSDRHRAFSGVLVDRLEEEGVPVASNTNHDPLEQDGGEQVKAFLRLLQSPADHLAWRTLIQQRNNRLGEVAIEELYSRCRNAGERFFQTVHRLAEQPDELPRYGTLLQEEIQQVGGQLEELRVDEDEEERDEGHLEELIPPVVEYCVDDDDSREEIIAHLQSVAEEAEATSVEELLGALSIADVEIEQTIEPDKVNILTMHQAKGLTAKTVFVVGAEDERIPGRATADHEIGDERRLLYVSLTRAKHRLFITYCNERPGRQSNFGRETDSPRRSLSRFLDASPLAPVDGQAYAYNYGPELEDDE